jgi:hypothetical protein
MSRKYSLAIHDLRLSGGDSCILMIRQLLETFNVPLAVHLVFDEEPANATLLIRFLQEKVSEGAIEVVFHGLTHQCSHNVSKTLVFYHKYQAEYLDDSELLRKKTAIMYAQLVTYFGYNPGICPPCWIAHPKNNLFFKSLKPAFVEKILFVKHQHSKAFSPVISLGSPNDRELFFLRGLANLMFFISLFLPNARTRMAIHLCDLEKPSSMAFFKRKVQQLTKKRFIPVLLRDIS